MKHLISDLAMTFIVLVIALINCAFSITYAVRLNKTLVISSWVALAILTAVLTIVYTNIEAYPDASLAGVFAIFGGVACFFDNIGETKNFLSDQRRRKERGW